MKRKPLIFVFTGDGGGKTIAALGFALRAVGNGQRVVMVQFMKGRKDTGEFKIQKKLGNLFKIYQFGSKGFIDLKRPAEADVARAKKGLEFAKDALSSKPNLLILDEVNLAASSGLLKVRDVISFLKSVPSTTNVVLTGRSAPKEFIKLADGASEVKKVKHAFDKGIAARRGIEF